MISKPFKVLVESYHLAMESQRLIKCTVSYSIIDNFLNAFNSLAQYGGFCASVEGHSEAVTITYKLLTRKSCETFYG